MQCDPGHSAGRSLSGINRIVVLDASRRWQLEPVA
jgi:hypothetical protein